MVLLLHLPAHQLLRVRGLWRGKNAEKESNSVCNCGRDLKNMSECSTETLGIDDQASFCNSLLGRAPPTHAEDNASETTAERKTYALPRCRAAAAVALPGG